MIEDYNYRIVSLPDDVRISKRDAPLVPLRCRTIRIICRSVDAASCFYIFNIAIEII